MEHAWEILRNPLTGAIALASGLAYTLYRVVTGRKRESPDLRGLLSDILSRVDSIREDRSTFAERLVRVESEVSSLHRVMEERRRHQEEARAELFATLKRMEDDMDRRIEEVRRMLQDALARVSRGRASQ